MYGFVVIDNTGGINTAGIVMGYSTLENILHCKVVEW